MISTIARLGDAMLSRLLPEAHAGACVGGVGTPCKCAAPCGATWCTQYYFACLGQCTTVNGTRC